MCDRISGGEFLDRYSEKTGFITAYCGICREWNLMDNMQQKCRIGFSGMCRNRTDFCGNINHNLQRKLSYKQQKAPEGAFHALNIH